MEGPYTHEQLESLLQGLGGLPSDTDQNDTFLDPTLLPASDLDLETCLYYSPPLPPLEEEVPDGAIATAVQGSQVKIQELQSEVEMLKIRYGSQMAWFRSLADFTKGGISEWVGRTNNWYLAASPLTARKGWSKTWNNIHKDLSRGLFRWWKHSTN